MKYGCKYADWDEEAHTLDEIKFVLAKFNLANISVPCGGDLDGDLPVRHGEAGIGGH